MNYLVRIDTVLLVQVDVCEGIFGLGSDRTCWDPLCLVHADVGEHSSAHLLLSVSGGQLCILGTAVSLGMR